MWISAMHLYDATGLFQQAPRIATAQKALFASPKGVRTKHRLQEWQKMLILRVVEDGGWVGNAGGALRQAPD